MYNQYLNMTADDSPPIHNEAFSENVPAFSEQAQKAPCMSSPAVPQQQAAALSELTRNISGKLQNIKFDMNTVIMLAIVWFLLSDNGEVDWDQFLTIGILFILGL